MRAAIPVVLLLACVAGDAHAQASRRAGTPTVAPAEMKCPAELGRGVKSKRDFCDVLIGRDPEAGVRIAVPPHRGTAMLLFSLHNRQTYSAQQEEAGRAYARATATIGVLTLDNTLLSRAVVMTEFRGEADLFDRIAGGAGPGGVKAVAPVGEERIAIEIPEGVDEVSLLGETLTVRRIDGEDRFASPGRPVATVSDVRIEYRPAPARRRR